MLRSFGRRQGRKLGTHKSALMQDLLPRILIVPPPEGASLSPQDIFGNAQPAELEIGFGGGEHLAHIARNHPARNFIGCEPYVNGIAGLLKDIEQEKLANIRVFTDDARLLLGWLPPESLEAAYIYYPDPWPKERHKKRRLVNTDTLALLARVLKPGSRLQIATDDVDYAEWILVHLLASPDFQWTAQAQADWKTPPDGWLSTKYEQKAFREGRFAHYFICTKR